MKNLIKKITPDFLLNWYYFALSALGAILYCFPSRKIKIIGVAGTDGKTTTTALIVAILEQARYKVASISTVRFKIGDKEWKNTLKMTMPGRFNLQQFLKQAVNARCDYAVLEVTDEGIKQHRHQFINFKTAVLTNITPEHIEAHGSFEKMRKENEKLFQIAKEAHIINLDDENAKYFLKHSSWQKFCYGLNNNLKIENCKFIRATNIRTSEKGIEFMVNNIKFCSELLGEFNIYNVLAAICVGLLEGISLEDCQKALEKFQGVPGRMEIIIKEPFRAIVDYAHTTASLEKVYQTIQDLKLNSLAGGQDSKLICVFGSCGGGRDKWKRPEFGEIAAKYCEEIILTNEDPYDENPDQVLENIEKGILKIKNLKLNENLKIKIKNYQKILDRREAIKKSLELAKPGDVVIITGKGREPWICVAEGKKIPWDDGKIVKEEFEKLYQL